MHKKNDRKDLSNYRGIALQDVIARLLSSIITDRLQQILRDNGIEEQFGCQSGRGTVDALFVIWLALQLRKEHQTDTYALFVDLVKAFDTANHDLLFALLERYGAPADLVDVIKKLHNNFKLKLKIENETCLVDYTVGVRQGDNMAPTLFIFLMQAFFTTFSKHWTKNKGQQPPKFYHHHDNLQGLLLRQQKPQKINKGTNEFQFLGPLFVDDCAFLLNSYAEAQMAAKEVKKHLSRFGLIMHVGIGDKKSKTEAMFIPASYDNDTPRIPDIIKIPDGTNVHFTNEFKYLGAIITNNLSNSAEIFARLKKAQCQIGALMNFFNSSCDFKTKLRIFEAIPLNTVLYGCESWNLNVALQKKLSVFFHSNLRRLLGITMPEVQEHHIRNEQLRSSLQIPNILETMRQRQFRAIGNFARLPLHRLPRRFITAWVAKPRPRGRPRNTLRNTLNDTIGSILSKEISDKGSPTSDWLPQATNKTEWNQQAKLWIEECIKNNQTSHGYHRLVQEKLNKLENNVNPPKSANTPQPSSSPVLTPVTSL